MSRKKQQSGSSGMFIAGLIGAGIGLLGGFIATKLLGEDEKKPVPAINNANQQNVVQQPQQPLQYQQAPPRTEAQQDSDSKFQEMMLCPITMQMMVEPMTIPICGHSFEKKVIVDYLNKEEKCPLCRKPSQAANLVPNYQLKNIIDHFRETRR